MLSKTTYIWRTLKETYNPEYLVPTAKHGGGSVMVWAAISCYSVGHIITLQDGITAREQMDRLGNQMHTMIQTLFVSEQRFSSPSSPRHQGPHSHTWNCSAMVWKA
jgi:hypothetical protein